MNASWRKVLKRLPGRSDLAWAAVPLAFAVLVILFFPFRYRIEFDTDEGINAIKAMMVLRGYSLYNEVWSDQPPFFTFLLASWFRIFGLRLTAGRGLVLLFSMGLIAAGTGYLRKTWGWLAAACGALIIILLPYFLRLSVSMMIGLPAIALAVASFCLLAEWHARPSLARLLICALLLGLSILTKGFTAFLVPIWFTGIVLTVVRTPALGADRGRRWVGPIAWLAVLGVVAAVGVLVVGPQNLSQLVDVHLQSAQSESFLVDPAHATLEDYLAESLPLFLLAIVGTGRAIRRRRWSALYLAGWVIAGYGLLAVNHPSWYHHQLLLTVPAALLAAPAVATSIDNVRRWAPRWPITPAFALSLVCLALFGASLVNRLPGTLDGLDARLPNFTGPQPGEESERNVLAAMGEYAGQTRWLFTDRPIFAFLTGLPVPPHLSVISQKRILTGDLSEEEIAAALEEYSPEMILNSRFPLGVVQEYMRTRNYFRIDSSLKYRLYFRRSP
jgi:4-amino-4-deoxy-L-arabinose transferase-like glycosyltransferase